MHPPSISVRTPKLCREIRKTKAVPAVVQGHSFVLGENHHKGEERVKDADVGIAAGAGRAIIFRKGQKVRVVPEDEMLTALMEEVERTPATA